MALVNHSQVANNDADHLAGDVNGGKHDVPWVMIQHTGAREEALQICQRRGRHLGRKVERPAHGLRLPRVEAQQQSLLLELDGLDLAARLCG